MKNDNIMGYKIALYIRASTEEQCTVEGTIKNQEERLKAEAKYRNQSGTFGEIIHTFVDAGKSAKDMKRPELQKMLNSIKRKEINLVMVTELSRLSRSVKDFVSMNDFFREHDCKFVSMKDQYDTSTAGGEMVMLTMANLAQFERRQVSERVSANFKARAERGLYNGGQVPYGYKLITGKKGYLAIDEEAAPAVRALFDAFLREGTTSRAAHWMNKNGYVMKHEVYGGGQSKPRRGHFTYQNTYDILTKPVYIGVKRFKDKDRFKEVRGCWEPIIDPITFERAQKLIESNIRRKRPDYPNRFPFLLSSLVQCSECKVSMIGKTANGNGGKVGYYDHGNLHRIYQCTDQKPKRCTHVRVQALKLEDAVWNEVKSHLSQPKIAKLIVEDAKAIHKEQTVNNESAVLKQKVTHLKRKLEGLAGRLGDIPDDVSPEPVFELMRKTEGEIKSSEKRIEVLGRDGGVKTIPVELEDYLKLTEALSKLNDADTETKTKIFECLIHKIEIIEDGFKIHFYAGEMEIERGLAQAGSLAPGGEALNLLSNGGSRVLTNGGSGRNRTGTSVKILDFESSASTNSTTEPGIKMNSEANIEFYIEQYSNLLKR